MKLFLGFSFSPLYRLVGTAENKEALNPPRTKIRPSRNIEIEKIPSGLTVFNISDMILITVVRVGYRKWDWLIDGPGGHREQAYITLIRRYSSVSSTFSRHELPAPLLTMLVNTGSPSDGPELLKSLAKLGVSPADVDVVVCTRGHIKHIGNLFSGSGKTVFYLGHDRFTPPDNYKDIESDFTNGSFNINIDVDMKDGRDEPITLMIPGEFLSLTADDANEDENDKDMEEDNCESCRRRACCPPGRSTRLCPPSPPSGRSS